MMLGLLLPLAWRNIWRNPRRTIITILVVSVGLWSILGFAVMLKAWSQSSRDTTLKLTTSEIEIHAPGYLDDPTIAHRMMPPAGNVAAILNSPSVTAYSPRVRISAIVQSEYKTLPLTLMGVSPREDGKISIIPSQVKQGRYLAGAAGNGIVLGRDLVRRLKTRLGKRVVVMAQAADGHLAERAFQVIGVYAAPEETEREFGFAGRTTVQRMTGAGNGISEIAIRPANGQSLSGLAAQLRAAAPNLDVQTWATLAPLAYAVSTFFNDFVVMWLWTMFVLMAIGIVNTQLMAVFERTREFGLLQALGMRPRLVLIEVTLESALLIGVGVTLGIVFAIASVRAFHNGIDLGFLAQGAEMVGAGHVLYPRIDAGDFALYSAIVWGLGVIATLWPARRASKIAPVEAMSRAIT
jgi:ABC-type lipoprotein release transport system permease subunit